MKTREANSVASPRRVALTGIKASHAPAPWTRGTARKSGQRRFFDQHSACTAALEAGNVS